MTETERLVDIRRDLRTTALAVRAELSAEIRHRFSREITARLEDYLVSKSAHCIHSYLSFRSEVETREFIAWALGESMHVIVPVIEEIEEVGGALREQLAHSEIHEVSSVVKGRFGIDEPVERSAASLEALDAVIVPVVAFDRRGTRLGYGKGFYDMFLRELPGRVERIGLAFGVQEVAAIPRLPHDEPLHTIITEQEIIRTQ